MFPRFSGEFWFQMPKNIRKMSQTRLTITGAEKRNDLQSLCLNESMYNAMAHTYAGCPRLFSGFFRVNLHVSWFFLGTHVVGIRWLFDAVCDDGSTRIGTGGGPNRIGWRETSVADTSCVSLGLSEKDGPRGRWLKDVQAETMALPLRRNECWTCVLGEAFRGSRRCGVKALVGKAHDPAAKWVDDLLVRELSK